MTRSARFAEAVVKLALRAAWTEERNRGRIVTREVGAPTLRTGCGLPAALGADEYHREACHPRILSRHLYDLNPETS